MKPHYEGEMMFPAKSRGDFLLRHSPARREFFLKKLAPPGRYPFGEVPPGCGTPWVLEEFFKGYLHRICGGAGCWRLGQGGSHINEGETGQRDRLEVDQGLGIPCGRRLAVEERVQRNIAGNRIEGAVPIVLLGGRVRGL